jgi:peroxiredoxin
MPGPVVTRPTVGQQAPAFALPSLAGTMVDLASYRGRRNVVVWFSRGFTCPFCRVYTDGMRAGYAELCAAETEIIQIAPNLLDSARRFFAHAPLPFPFVCDPDKRLYAVYGLGDVGALEATKTAVVSFAHAFTHGDSRNQVRGAWLDVVNRNFLRRLHHHAMTAQEQGMFLIDKDGIVRSVAVVGPIDPVPGGAELAALARRHCGPPARVPSPA